MSKVNLIQCLNEYKEITIETIKLLKEKVADIGVYHKKCNVVKTVGTSTATVGSIVSIGSFIAAPFTGGSSIVAASGIGAAITLTGTALNLGADVVDLVESKSFHKTLKDIVEKRNVFVKNLQDRLEEIQIKAENLQKNGLSEEESLVLAFNGAVKGYDVYKVVNDVLSLSRKFRIENNFLNFSLRNGGQVWMNLRLNSEKLIVVLAKLGFNIGKKTAMNVVRNGTVILSTIYVYRDIDSLINMWKNKHTAENSVLELIEDIERDLSNVQELINVLEIDLKI
jgi:hypothetical protein